MAAAVAHLAAGSASSDHIATVVIGKVMNATGAWAAFCADSATLASRRPAMLIRLLDCFMPGDVGGDLRSPWWYASAAQLWLKKRAPRPSHPRPHHRMSREPRLEGCGTLEAEHRTAPPGRNGPGAERGTRRPTEKLRRQQRRRAPAAEKQPADPAVVPAAHVVHEHALAGCVLGQPRGVRLRRIRRSGRGTAARTGGAGL